MKKYIEKYFLAANSCQGFKSSFSESFNPLLGWKAYIIKGGPGTGKSSFMKKIAQRAAEYNTEVILCPCSSDPDSLDGVILPSKKIIVLDGTSPHAIEPKYPAVCEAVLNFGEYWNPSAFESPKEIIALTDKNKLFHKSAARYLKSAGELLENNYRLCLEGANIEKITGFAQKLCKKYIEKSNLSPLEWVRYLNGVTPKGIISLTDSLDRFERIIIEDKYSAVSNIIMEEIRSYALKQGREIITVKNALLPETLTDHIIIPSLSLAFVTEHQYFKLQSEERRIHARRFLNTSTMSKNRQRLKINLKAANQILEYAISTLKEAKLVHDSLEKHYIKAMDFEKLNELCDNLCSEIF